MGNYEKAIRHSRNKRKGRNMHLGFDTSSGQWKSIWATQIECTTCQKYTPICFVNQAGICDKCTKQRDKNWKPIEI